LLRILERIDQIDQKQSRKCCHCLGFTNKNKSFFAQDCCEHQEHLLVSKVGEEYGAAV